MTKLDHDNALVTAHAGYVAAQNIAEAAFIAAQSAADAQYVAERIAADAAYNAAYEPAHGDVPDGSIRSHAYNAMTIAYGYGCKVCGRSILSHADRGSLA